MRAWVLQGNGVETLTLEERPPPRPGPGQVRVRMRAASLNYRDLLVASGTYGSAAPRRPLVPLSDGAGEVVEVGDGVSGVRAGDRVVANFFQGWLDGPQTDATNATALGGAVDGVLAEEVVFQAAAVVPVPAHLSFEEAATLPCAALTAWVALFERGKLAASQTVLVQGTGGVSLCGLQLAKAAGARVILTSRSAAKLSRAVTLGADDTIDTVRTPDWDATARALTGGEGVDHLLEVIGAATLPRSIRAMKPGGHLTLVGLLSGARSDPAAARAQAPGVNVSGVFVGSVRMFERMNAFLARHAIRPVLDERFPFARARDAYAHLAAGNHFGKVVIGISRGPRPLHLSSRSRCPSSRARAASRSAPRRRRPS
ncbi:MAG: NAD(P)-dependent alcohol dehydrogenase [Anaeromyxobacteraceae bacterium]